MKKRTKALAIPPEVKRIVWERDDGLCVLCGRPGIPNAHFIPRSRGGLGIEENIVTLCPECHMRYDNGTGRYWMEAEIRNYLRSKYKNFDELDLQYQKG